MLKYQAVRGTKDILPAESARFQRLESHARGMFDRFGYQEIRTPTFEMLELFQRSLGETTDVVQKEMYVFEDRGGRKLALRPEGTAGVVRAFIEHHLSQTTPFCKLFYIGPMFRAERPQAGRYREFWQIGAEYFGNASPTADAELLVLLDALLQSIPHPHPLPSREREKGEGWFRLKVNSLGDSVCRPKYLEALKSYIKSRLSDLCEDCQKRAERNPLRVLDCKTDGPKLKDVPTIDNFWCDPCRTHFNKVTHLLKAENVSFELTPRLVRGLDYYTRTVFEVTTNVLGAQDALAAGGRYDTLVKELGGPDVPALGFAMGVERVIQAAEAVKKQSTAPSNSAGMKVFVAAMGEAAAREAFLLLQQLRLSPELKDHHITVEGGFFEKKLGAQLTMADRIGATHCAILGEDEVREGKVTLKSLQASTQKTIEKSELIPHLIALG